MQLNPETATDFFYVNMILVSKSCPEALRAQQNPQKAGLDYRFAK